MVRLVPMNETEFQAYLDLVLPAYAQDHARAGNFSAENALELAKLQVQQILPDGLATQNQYFFYIEDETLANRVGVLWFAVQNRGSGPIAFVYDVRVYEEFQRRGYGTQAFQVLEEKAQEMGLTTISLHVFGHNHPARAMYKKLGYVETDVMMSKTIST
jgi:ribosomal protein S18 acetylase RimI-like enzyme